MLTWLELFVGDNILSELGLINDNNRQRVIWILIILTLITLFISFRPKQLKFNWRGNYASSKSLFLMPIIFFIPIGFVWDIFTSIDGFYKLFATENSNQSLKLIAYILAIVTTSVSFFITLLAVNIILEIPKTFPVNLIKQEIVSQIKKGILLKRIYIFLFVLANFFDFYTSLSGNAALLGFEDIQKIPTMPSMVLLAIGTFFICLCQYIFWIFFTIE